MPEPGVSVWGRLTGAFTVALAFALAVYGLMTLLDPDEGVIGFGFLVVLPAALSAFVAYVADPLGRKGAGAYALVPVVLVGLVSLLALFVLREGVVCLVLLAPIWLASGLGGAMATYGLRRRLARAGRAGGRSYVTVWAVAPLLVLSAEAHLPRPEAEVTVVRSIEIAASPEVIWPLLEGMGDLRPDEGLWTFTHSVIGLPRPVSARLEGQGLGAARHAVWQRDIRFEEVITEWEPLRRIGWRFQFGDPRGWDLTDAHLMPDSAYMQIRRGGYSLMPVPGGKVRVSLDTTYWMRTPVNGYAALWGEVFLGEMEANLLAILKARAEMVAAPTALGQNSG